MNDEHKVSSRRYVFVYVCAVIGFVAYVGYQLVYERYVLLRPRPAQAKNLGYSSEWFEGQKEGRACSTWLTCRSAGARVRELYIDQNNTRYELGTIRLGRHFTDVNGRTPVGTEMTLCKGRDEGVSMKIQKVDEKSLYNGKNNDHIIITIKADEDGKEKKYQYELPHGFDPYMGDAKFHIVYEARVGDITDSYAQVSTMKACEGGAQS